MSISEKEWIAVSSAPFHLPSSQSVFSKRWDWIENSPKADPFFPQQCHLSQLLVEITAHREVIDLCHALFLHPICFTMGNSKWSCQSLALSCDGALIFTYLLEMSMSSQMSAAISIQMVEHNKYEKAFLLCMSITNSLYWHPQESSLWLERHNNWRHWGIGWGLKKKKKRKSLVWSTS